MSALVDVMQRLEKDLGKKYDALSGAKETEQGNRLLNEMEDHTTHYSSPTKQVTARLRASSVLQKVRLKILRLNMSCKTKGALEGLLS